MVSITSHFNHWGSEVPNNKETKDSPFWEKMQTINGLTFKHMMGQYRVEPAYLRTPIPTPLQEAAARRMEAVVLVFGVSHLHLQCPPPAPPPSSSLFFLRCSYRAREYYEYGVYRTGKHLLSIRPDNSDIWTLCDFSLTVGWTRVFTRSKPSRTCKTTGSSNLDHPKLSVEDTTESGKMKMQILKHFVQVNTV